MGKTAIIIGATGLVGGHLLRELLNDNHYSSVKVFGRRSAGISHTKLKEFIIDFESIEDVKSEIKGNVLFSCLGTTLKQAGSKAMQYMVDYTYQFEFAKIAAENGIKDYILVSSTGANAKSMFFYPRIKGKLEEDVIELSFNTVRLIQPSLLIGSREKRRVMEDLSAKILPTVIKIIPSLRKYRGIEGAIVAKAMVNISKQHFDKRVETFHLDTLFSYV